VSAAFTTRVLPHEEWSRLGRTSLRKIWGRLDPARNTIVVVERRGAIVGTVMLMQAVHAECLWIAPDHRRKASVLRRLRARAFVEARQQGAPTLLAAALSTRMQRLLVKLGARPLPGVHMVMLTKGAR